MELLTANQLACKHFFHSLPFILIRADGFTRVMSVLKKIQNIFYQRIKDLGVAFQKRDILWGPGAVSLDAECRSYGRGVYQVH